MRILGIDPGLGLIGFGMVEFNRSGVPMGCEWGVISTSKHKSDAARLQEIYADMTRLLQTLNPDRVSIEQLFFCKNAKTLIPVSQARGVILLTLENLGLPYFEYTPMQVKQAMTGYGKSDKREIQGMVAQLLGLERVPKPDDAADALALAICHYNHLLLAERTVKIG